jgi:hypothetical protein
MNAKCEYNQLFGDTLCKDTQLEVISIMQMLKMSTVLMLSPENEHINVQRSSTDGRPFASFKTPIQGGSPMHCTLDNLTHNVRYD